MFNTVIKIYLMCLSYPVDCEFLEDKDLICVSLQSFTVPYNIPNTVDNATIVGELNEGMNDYLL